MDWNFLTRIARDIQIPIVSPYRKLSESKLLFVDCYIKVGKTYIDFSNGFGVAYSKFLRSTFTLRKDFHNNKPIIADLTEIVDKSGLSLDDVKTALSLILDLFILGRLTHRGITVTPQILQAGLLIPKQIVFPLMYLLNVLEAEYHIEALLTYTLAHLYNKVYDKSFVGYSTDDRLELLYYLVLLITFEQSNPALIYRFLSENTTSRFVDILSLVKDYLTPDYITSVIPTIYRLSIAHNDMYVIVDNSCDSIEFIKTHNCTIGITDRRRPELKPIGELTDLDIPLIIYNNLGYNLRIKHLPRMITYQMVQDRLPLDINRTTVINIEGAIVSVLLPYIHTCHFADSPTNLTFHIYYADFDTAGNINVRQVICHLTSDGIILQQIIPFIQCISSNSTTIFTEDNISLVTRQVKELLSKTDPADTHYVVVVSELQFGSLYPDDYITVSDTLSNNLTVGSPVRTPRSPIRSN